jgi:hypothetical protein
MSLGEARDQRRLASGSFVLNLCPLHSPAWSMRPWESAPAPSSSRQTDSQDRMDQRSPDHGGKRLIKGYRLGVFCRRPHLSPPDPPHRRACTDDLGGGLAREAGVNRADEHRAWGRHRLSFLPGRTGRPRRSPSRLLAETAATFRIPSVRGMAPRSGTAMR